MAELKQRDLAGCMNNNMIIGYEESMTDNALYISDERGNDKLAGLACFANLEKHGAGVC